MSKIFERGYWWKTAEQCGGTTRNCKVTIRAEKSIATVLNDDNTRPHHRAVDWVQLVAIQWVANVDTAAVSEPSLMTLLFISE